MEGKEFSQIRHYLGKSQSQLVLHFGSYQEVGFTGSCTFELDRNAPDEALIFLNALADFAFYCGTGAKTTMGMGQTRRARGARNTKRTAGGDVGPRTQAK